MLQEYWVLNGLDELALVYLEIRSHLTLFLRLFHIMKKSKLITQKYIQTILKHAAHDIQSLENKYYRHANDVLDLEIRKKELTTSTSIIFYSRFPLQQIDKDIYH